MRCRGDRCSGQCGSAWMIGVSQWAGNANRARIGWRVRPSRLRFSGDRRSMARSCRRSNSRWLRSARPAVRKGACSTAPVRHRRRRLACRMRRKRRRLGLDRGAMLMSEKTCLPSRPALDLDDRGRAWGAVSHAAAGSCRQRRSQGTRLGRPAAFIYRIVMSRLAAGWR